MTPPTPYPENTVLVQGPSTHKRVLVGYSVTGLRYRAATTKCLLLSWNCAGAGVGPRPPLRTGSLDPLESRSRLGLWVQGGMRENIAIAGFGRFIGRGESSLAYLLIRSPIQWPGVSNMHVWRWVICRCIRDTLAQGMREW